MSTAREPMRRQSDDAAKRGVTRNGDLISRETIGSLFIADGSQGFSRETQFWADTTAFSIG